MVVMKLIDNITNTSCCVLNDSKLVRSFAKLDKKIMYLVLVVMSVLVVALSCYYQSRRSLQPSIKSAEVHKSTTAIAAAAIARSKNPDWGPDWAYWSDHFPVATVLEGKVSIISWNILNQQWLDKFFLPQNNPTDERGLNRSPLVAYPKEERELKVAETVISMLTKNEEQTTVVCLQECSKEMIQLLQDKIQEKAPGRFKILHSEREYNDLGVVIYDQLMLTESELVVKHGIYPAGPTYFLIDVQLTCKNSDMHFRLLNTHQPFTHNPKTVNSPECLAGYVKEHLDPGVTTVVLGDMNNTIEKVQTALNNSRFQFSLASSDCYFTQVGGTRMPQICDHIYVHGGNFVPSSISSVDPVAHEVIKKIGFFIS